MATVAEINVASDVLKSCATTVATCQNVCERASFVLREASNFTQIAKGDWQLENALIELKSAILIILEQAKSITNQANAVAVAAKTAATT